MVKYLSSVDLDFVFMALANPTRRGILLELQRGERSAQDLAEPFDVSLPALSKHLKVLEKARLIRRDIRGRHHLFTVKPGNLQKASDWVAQFEIFWNEKLSKLETYLNEEND